MHAVYARYRGRDLHRGDLVRRSAAALRTLPGLGQVTSLGVEELGLTTEDSEAAISMVMALVSATDWRIGLGTAGTEQRALAAAQHASRRRVPVGVDVEKRKDPDAEAAFALLAHVLEKRSFEGRQATSLMRQGLNQVEAAAELGVSKQAVSQRLRAAGWQAELSGWQLAVNLVARPAAQRG